MIDSVDIYTSFTAGSAIPCRPVVPGSAPSCNMTTFNIGLWRLLFWFLVFLPGVAVSDPFYCHSRDDDVL